MVSNKIILIRFINDCVYKIQITIYSYKNIIWCSIKNIMNTIRIIFTIHLRLKAKTQ